MDKCFFFYRPKMAKVLRETVATQLRKNLTVLKDKHFRARVKYADDYEKPVKKYGGPAC